MKKTLILITLVLGFISFSFASYVPTQKESQTLKLIKLKLESLVKNDATKADNFRNQLASLKEKYSNNERANYILDYLLDILKINEKDNIGAVNTQESIGSLNIKLGYNEEKEEWNIKSYLVGKSGIVAGPYYVTEDLNDGYSLVQKNNSDGENGDRKIYFVNSNGKEVAGPYADASSFSDGYASIKKEDGKYYLVNTSFKEVTGPYNYIGSFVDGYIAVKKDDGNWYYLDKKFDNMAGPYTQASNFDNGIATVKKSDGAYYILNKDFKETKLPYTYIENFNSQGFEQFTNGYALVTFEDGKKYYVDISGKKVAGPYDEIDGFTNFSDGYAIIQKSEKGGESAYYIIDTNGKEVAGPFQEANKFVNGYTFVRTSNGVIKILDKNLKQIGGDYDLGKIGYYLFSNDGYAIIQNSDGVFFIDKNGKKVSSSYSDAVNFNNGYAAVQKDDGNWYIIDKNFKEISGALDIQN